MTTEEPQFSPGQLVTVDPVRRDGVYYARKAGIPLKTGAVSPPLVPVSSETVGIYIGPAVKRISRRALSIASPARELVLVGENILLIPILRLRPYVDK